MIQAMVVDDSAVMRKVARRIFEGLQFETAEAEDGVKALQACADLMPDVILLDWNMPVMDGFAFLRALRQLPGGRKPNVLVCTSERDPVHITRFMHAGANNIMMKPFDRKILTLKLEEMGLVEAAVA